VSVTVDGVVNVVAIAGSLVSALKSLFGKRRKK
jgi:hypothetical protein